MTSQDRNAPNATNYQKPTPIHLTPGEIDEMQTLIDQGELPRDAIKRHFEAEEKNVFGHDAKKDSQGRYIEQGIGSPGHESLNHFVAIQKAEREGYEPPGSYRRAVEEMWKRDPKHAQAINLPKPPTRPEPRNNGAVT